MLRVVLTAISFSFVLHPSFTQAQDRQSFKNLHVEIADSCKIADKAGEHGGGFVAPTKCVSSAFAAYTSLQAKVYRVLDGDTIHVWIGGKVYGIRMLGMDTPELHYLGKSQPLWGERARQSLMSMVHAGDIVKIEFDREKCDKYGRILVHVYKGTTNLNYAQIRLGMAANYCIAPNTKYCDQYGDAYAYAKSNRLGFHVDQCMVTPYVWRKALQAKMMDKRVKNRQTGAMLAPNDYYKIPVADRVFYPSSVAGDEQYGEPYPADYTDFL